METLDLNVKVETVEKTTVTLPQFWKKQQSADWLILLGAINKQNVIRLERSSNHANIQVYSADIMAGDISTALRQGWEQISETEWLELYEKNVKLFSLKPVLKEISNYDQAQLERYCNVLPEPIVMPDGEVEAGAEEMERSAKWVEDQAEKQLLDHEQQFLNNE